MMKSAWEIAEDKFGGLEDRLERLLESIDALKAENAELKGALGLRDLEIKGLKHKLGKLDREKSMVREKVDGLLTKLDSLAQGASNV